MGAGTDPEANPYERAGVGQDVPSHRPGSLEEYERLAAERDRLIAAGVPAAQLTVPLAPEVGDVLDQEDRDVMYAMQSWDAAERNP